MPTATMTATLCAEPDWRDAEDEFLAAIGPDQRPRVRALLENPRRGGRGLRSWFALVESGLRGAAAVPAEVVEVYLTDDEAEPLYDCERCGLPVPVRAGRRCGHEPTPERVYFASCPRCGGKTGRHAFWSANRPAG